MASIFTILLLTGFVVSFKAFETHEDHQHRSKRENRRGKGPTIGEQSKKTFEHMQKMAIEKIEKGTDTGKYCIFYRSARGPISPLHDIPLYTHFSQKIVNMIVETPSWTNEKMVINLKEPLNPITKGIKRGGYIWNYGALPQTWQNPDENDSFTGLKGDGSPLDILDLGEESFKAGDVIQVKVLAAIGLNYEGKTNWKIIGIYVKDREAHDMHNIEDVERNFPGMLETTVNWNKYWFPDRKIKVFEKPKDREFAHKVIQACNKQWVRLMEGKVEAPGMSLLNTCIRGSKGQVSFDAAEEELNKRTFPTGVPTDVWGDPYDANNPTDLYTLPPPP